MTAWTFHPTIRGSDDQGFTLLELVIALVIVGLIASLVIVMVTPAPYRLKSAIREIGSTIEMANGVAATTGRNVTLIYNQSEGRYWLEVGAPVVEPFEGEQEFGAEPLPEEGEAEPLGERELPIGVEFVEVRGLDNEPVNENPIQISFDMLGINGSHVVVLRLLPEYDEGNEHLISVRYHALTGIADYSFMDEEALAFPEYEGNLGG